MNTDSVYVDLAFWLMFVFCIAGAIWLTAYINNKKARKQLNRRNKKRPAERQAFDDCSISCEKIKYYQNSIEDLKDEIEYWKTAYQSAEIRCALMQDTITKLRTVQNEKRK